MSPTTKPTILIVGNQPRRVGLMAEFLTSDGFNTERASSAKDIKPLIQKFAPAMLIVSMPLPGWDPKEQVAKLRDEFPGAALFLVVENGLVDGLLAPELIPFFAEGAEEIVSWPLTLEELSARVRAVLRRFAPTSKRKTGEVVKCPGGVEIDLDRHRVKKNGQIVSLTPNESKLLEYLAENPGRCILNAQLLSIWDVEYKDNLQYHRMWISRLRSKLEENPRKPVVIITVPGVGYTLAQKGQEERIARLITEMQFDRGAAPTASLPVEMAAS